MEVTLLLEDPVLVLVLCSFVLFLVFFFFFFFFRFSGLSSFSGFGALPPEDVGFFHFHTRRCWFLSLP